jgi:peptidoglycan-N-acetylglucosamine deacetylase
VKNAITIDVEDWFHICGWDGDPPPAPPGQGRVLRNVATLLRLLAQHQVQATFFVLGAIADAEPELIPLIAAGGHEIASHGYSHRLVHKLGATGFRDELQRTATVIQRQWGRRPVGYRAPQWSLRQTDSWAFTILQEEGYRYDSSMSPLPLVGNRNGPLMPFNIRTATGTIIEIPPMVTPWPGCNLPTGGGWGFRFFPAWLIGTTIRYYNRKGSGAVLYLHPREVDPQGPRLDFSALQSFAVYGPRVSVEHRLRWLLERFQFTTLEKMAASCQPA